MSDSNSRGRGRGLEFLLKKVSERPETPGSTSRVSPEGESQLTPSTLLSIRGRGQSILLDKKHESKSGDSIVCPASDVRPSSSSSMPVSLGRGSRILATLCSKSQETKQLTSMSNVAASQLLGDSSAVSTQFSKMTIRKNKPHAEVKDTPPVVKKGTSGQEVEVTANYIYLKRKPGMGVYEYEVRYTPEIDYRGVKISLLNEHKNVIGHTKTFDGTTLYLPIQLPEAETILESKHPSDGSKVILKIIYRREGKLSEKVHIFNVLFKNIMRELDLTRINRQHFDQRSAAQIPQHKLEVWPGYVTAVQEFEGGLMLTLDSTHRVLRTQTVLNFIRELIDRDKVNWKDNFVQSLIGTSVMTFYNKKIYKVDDLDEKMTPMSSFTSSDGTEMTFMEYYKKQYNIEILDHNQPLLISRQTKRVSGSEKPIEYSIRLVPELCRLTGLTEAMRNDFKLMKDVAMYTRVTPNQRHRAFKQYIKNVLSNENAKRLLANWGVEVATDTVKLTSRVLDREKMTFGNRMTSIVSHNSDWTRECSKNPMLETVDINNWLMVFTKKDARLAQEFVDCLMRCGPNMGMHVSKPFMEVLQSDRTEAYATLLKNFDFSTIQLVVTLCPTSRDDRYSVIKKICCADNPIPSQVINARTIMNRDKQRSVVQKIALQLNCKLGGALWSVSIPYKNAMIIGIDSYHEASRKNRSVCGFVASYNASLTHWYSRVCFQERGQEIVDGLKTCFIESLKFYNAQNGCYPDRIFLYRDGVGDGQIKVVSEYEIPQLAECFELISGSYRPHLTCILVQKRINTRIFSYLNTSDLDNPPAGTVVDNTITRRDMYDFFLVSQKVNQGTVTPTHYIVVYDNSNLSPDHAQRLSYKLTHLYYNWSGTVRVPAPCQYAHKLAYLVGQSIHQEHNAVLADKLFFL